MKEIVVITIPSRSNGDKDHLFLNVEQILAENNAEIEKTINEMHKEIEKNNQSPISGVVTVTKKDLITQFMEHFNDNTKKDRDNGRNKT